MSVHAANEKSYDASGRWRTQTYAHIGTVGGVDETLYIKGDEFTDGSKRIIFVSIDDSPQFQERVGGEWVISPVTFSSRAFVIDGGRPGIAAWEFDEDGEFVRVGENP